MAWLTGTVADDRLTGGADSDTLLGLAGDDALLGGDGADYLSGDAGDDRLEGGAGADFLLDRSGTDTLLGGDGNDTIYALATAFIDGGAGADFLYGDGPDNTFSAGTATTRSVPASAARSRAAPGATTSPCRRVSSIAARAARHRSWSRISWPVRSATGWSSPAC